MSKIKRYKKLIKVHKRLKLKFPKKSVILLMILLPLLAIAVFLIAFYFMVVKDLPSPTKLSNTTDSYSTQIYDRNGKLLYTIYANRNQTFVSLSKIPKTLQEATIAVEDKDFYKHGAVDIRGLIRAFYQTFFHKQIQGGSTLTQQLVKNGLLSPEQTYTRKIKELILSFATEVMYSKNKILEMYLNQVPYGGTSYGVEAAAHTFFSKAAKDLTLAEQAFLAGLPEAPSTFSPYGSHPELGKQRQEEILQKMTEQDYITAKQRDAAIAEQLHFAKITNPIRAPHFVFYVKDLLEKKYGEQTVEQGGLKVYTSLDLTIQNFAQDTVASEVAGLKDYKVGNGAALITDPSTGEILAMVGSIDYFDSKHDGNVNIALAHLQPGSSIKPINYAIGLMNGYTPESLFIDAAICFPSPGTIPYCPRNYDGKFHGVVSMRTALGNSFNIPAVEMLKLNGVPAMVATASAMGITSYKDPSQYGLSLTLGGGEVTMLEMATAFGVFANQGYRIDLHPILKITDNKNNVLEEYDPPKSPIFGTKVLPPGVAWIMSNMLADNNARLMEFGPSSELKIGQQFIPAKTGTTNDFRDNWTIGYTPSRLVAVWVGNNDHSPMAGIASGITGAAPIWHKLMAHLVEGKILKSPPKPPDVIEKYTCIGSNTPDTSDAPRQCSSRADLALKGVPIKSASIGKQAVWVDKSTQNLAKPGQTDNVEPKEETVLTDPLGNQYCISCPIPTPSPTPVK